MDELPQALVLEILSRLDDSADVARCRVAWKTFDTLSPGLRSINLQWPLPSYIELRSRVSNPSNSSQLTSPLKTTFLKLVSNLRVVESVCIGVEKLPLGLTHKDAEDKANDLYLTDGDFIKEWLPRVSRELKSLSISDFWLQSRGRRSNVLSLVSFYCHNLVELELKNAWLSVENLNPMPMLTSLKLESIELDDEELSQLNECFPNLEVLHLIQVGGLKLPIIRLLNLKTCHWTVAYPPAYLSVIAPKLITLTLKSSISPDAVHIEAPMLCHFHLEINHLSKFTAENLHNLKTLWLETSYILLLLIRFPYLDRVENLTLDSRGSAKDPIGDQFKFTLERLFRVFPNVTSLCFKSRVWLEFEANRSPFAWVMTGGRVETFHGYLLLKDIKSTLSAVACVVKECSDLVDVSLFIHHDVVSSVAKSFMRMCMGKWPDVNWRWGIWDEGKEDYWISNACLRHMSSNRKVEFRCLKKQRD